MKISSYPVPSSVLETNILLSTRFRDPSEAGPPLNSSTSLQGDTAYIQEDALFMLIAVRTSNL